MIAHCHGQIWSSAELARSLGSAEATARKYLDILTQAFMVRQLSPWFENVAKRQVESPKVYVRDSGMLHSLLGIETPLALQGHPKLGASWEGFALEQVLQITGNRHAYFWATHGGAELDLLVTAGVRRWGFELKHTDAPTITKSMHVALGDLNLSRLLVVHPGPNSYRLAQKVQALSVVPGERPAKPVRSSRKLDSATRPPMPGTPAAMHDRQDNDLVGNRPKVHGVRKSADERPPCVALHAGIG